MRSDEAARIYIRDNIQSARGFTDGILFDDFAGSRLTFYATTRALEIISEAARRLSQVASVRGPD